MPDSGSRHHTRHSTPSRRDRDRRSASHSASAVAAPAKRKRPPSKHPSASGSSSTAVPRSSRGGRRSTSARDSSSEASSEASADRKRPASSPPRKAATAQRRPGPVKFQHRRTGGEVHRCKKGKRTDIKPAEWDKYGYAVNDEVLRRPITYDDQTRPIPRVKRGDITPAQFLEQYAKKHQPVIVEDCTNDWPAMERWALDVMEERFRHVAFKVAKDDKGKKLRMKFKYYRDYTQHQQDDSPLYLFETNVDDNGFIRPLVEDFEIPDLFPHDYMALVNQDARPPFRWFCIGPKRSGTTIHTDPLGTAAWNAVTHGCKHWVLMDPKESKRVVKGKDVIKDGEDDEAIMYYDFILPRIKKAHPELRVYEGLQGPGEIIFVPGDWWHAVLNREDTVAVTQNYCGPDNFEIVWKKTRKEREKVAHLWLRNMRKYAPSLHEEAVAMNKQDKFRMRHERAKGERLSDCSSSSSESSSDSTSDEAGDLTETGLGSVLPPGATMGAAARRAAASRLATNVQPRCVPAPDLRQQRLQSQGAPADQDPQKRRRVLEAA